MSYSLRAGLAGLAAIALGLILAPATPARAFEISPRIGSLLRDQHACWQLERVDRTSGGWKEQKELRTGPELRGMIQDDQYNAIFNPTGITSVSVDVIWRTTYINTPTHNEQNPDHPNHERWRRVPCPGEPAAEAKEEMPTLPALEQSSPQPMRPANQTAYGGPYGSPNVTATVDVVNAHSTWKITSPTDQVKTTSDTPQLQFTGQINWGPFYLSGTAMGAGNARGSFSDTFFGFPVATTGTVTSGSNNAFTTSAGFNFFNVAAGLSVGAFGLYDLNLESLYGNTAFSWSGQLSLLETRSQAAGGGLIVNDAFTVGNVPFLFSGSIAGLADNVKSGMFDGNGSGWQANARLTFPLGPVHGNLFAQYTDINASGNVLGSPLTFDNRTWLFGGGITATFSFEPDNSRQFGGR